MRIGASPWWRMLALGLSLTAAACGGGGDIEDELAACEEECDAINQGGGGKVCFGCFPRAASLPAGEGDVEETLTQSTRPLEPERRLGAAALAVDSENVSVHVRAFAPALDQIVLQSEPADTLAR